MNDVTEKTKLFGEMKHAFLDSFPGAPNLQASKPDYVRCCADKSRVNDWVWYEIQHYKNDCCMLRFCVDSYAPSRHELQKDVMALFQKDRELHRYFYGRGYYNAYFVEGRNPITSVDDLKHDLGILKSKIDDIIQRRFECAITQSDSTVKDTVTISANDVTSLLSKEAFRIPDYQRGYCWKKNNIIGLLEDIQQWQASHKEGCYQVGSIVLYRKAGENVYDVIDGQQRLLTLSMLALRMGKGYGGNIEVGANNKRQTAVWHLLNARQEIDGWLGRKKAVTNNANEENAIVDLSRIQVSVVRINGQNSQDADLPFLFFNHLNSLGRRLSDYDLLKSHHLRFIKGDGLSKTMAKRWHSIDKTSNEKLKDIDLKSEVLHSMMFRLRNWRSKSDFSYYADNSISRELFRHFTMDFTPVQDLCTSYKELRFDSILSGGLEFFNYVDCYRRKYEAFCETPGYGLLRKYLCWHSNGVLYDGIRALSFLFFCKFGDVYLSDAMYCIAYRVSILRNEYQVRRNSLNGQEFQSIAQLIDRVTHESEFLGTLLDARNRYSISNHGSTAMNYWNCLRALGKELKTIMSANIESVIDLLEP